MGRLISVAPTQPFPDPVGHVFHARRDDGKSKKGTPLQVVGLFQNGDKKKIFGLAWKVNRGVPEGLSAYQDKRRIGRIRSLSEIAPKAEAMDKLFAVIEFSDDVTPILLDQAKKAAVSRDLTRNIFARRGMRVRKMNFDSVSSVKRRSGPKMVGNIFNPKIAIDGVPLKLERATVVRESGKPWDEGQPIISDSNALVGFVLAADEMKTLVLPAIDIENKANVKFLTLADEVVGRAGRNWQPSYDEVRPKRLVTAERKWRKATAEF